MKTISVELTGIAATLAGTRATQINLPPEGTYRDILRTLAERYPDMVGILIAPDGENFLSSNMFVINGDLATTAMLLDETPADGEEIHLMSVITGG
jgi:molybdopterin converting factor small subunit